MKLPRKAAFRLPLGASLAGSLADARKSSAGIRQDLPGLQDDGRRETFECNVETEFNGTVPPGSGCAEEGS